MYFGVAVVVDVNIKWVSFLVFGVFFGETYKTEGIDKIVFLSHLTTQTPTLFIAWVTFVHESF